MVILFTIILLLFALNHQLLTNLAFELFIIHLPLKHQTNLDTLHITNFDEIHSIFYLILMISIQLT